MIAWTLLRRLVPAAALSNPCPRCGGPHGPVRVEGAPFRASVSYAAGWAVVAVVGDAEADAIGVDAEAVVDARREAAGLRGVLGSGEATVRDWTRVEAALKADGRGVGVDPALVRIAPRDDGWSAAVPNPAGGSLVYRGWDLVGPPELVLSVAVRPAS